MRGKKHLSEVKGLKMGVQYLSEGILTVSYLLTANCHNPCSSLQNISLALNKGAQVVGF